MTSALAARSVGGDRLQRPACRVGVDGGAIARQLVAVEVVAAASDVQSLRGQRQVHEPPPAPKITAAMFVL